MKTLLFSACLLGFIACHTPMQISETKIYPNTKITKSIASDAEFVKTIAPYKKKLEEKMNQKIAHTNFNLDKSSDNSPLGNLLADYTWEGAKDWAKNQNLKIDGAIINSGGIRSTIGKGDILLKHIFEVMPFENELVIVQFSGDKMQGIFDYYQEKQKNNPVANFIIEIDNNQISKALLNSQLIDENKTYYIATSDYLATGGDGMIFFKAGKMISTGIKLRDLYIEKFKDKREIIPPKDIRLTFKDKK